MKQNSTPIKILKWLLLAVLAGIVTYYALTPAQAQSWPNNGVMPNVGAMAYDLSLSKKSNPSGMRMTGFASSRGGIVRWVHCKQTRMMPFKACHLLLNNRPGKAFPPAPPN